MGFAACSIIYLSSSEGVLFHEFGVVNGVEDSLLYMVKLMEIIKAMTVLISAVLSANGFPYQIYVKTVTYPNHGSICEQNVEEMKWIFNKILPNRLAA